MPDSARELFDEFVRQGYRRIELAVKTNEPEHQFLDFKEFPTDQKQARKTFGHIASAFANSYGGVIVWGIEAKGTTVAEKPIDGVGEALRLLNLMPSQALDPVVKGIVSHAIYKSMAADTGFVVTYVPASDNQPHQSVPQHGYFIRRSGSTHPMTHREVEMFVLARATPRVNIKVTRLKKVVSGHVEFWEFSLVAHSLGRVPLRQLAFFVRATPALYRFDSKVLPARPGVSNPYFDGVRYHEMQTTRDFAMYPGTETILAELVVRDNEIVDGLDLSCKLYGEDFAASYTFTLGTDYFLPKLGAGTTVDSNQLDIVLTVEPDGD